MLRLSMTRDLVGIAVLMALSVTPLGAQQIILAAAPQDAAPKPDEKQLTPEQKMNSRYPQPVRVGFLIGLPMLDDRGTTLGYIQQVVRTPEGKILLVVNYRA
jgi:hypothetical protein